MSLPAEPDVIEEMAARLAKTTWGERGPLFVSRHYSTHVDGRNTVREHYVALAKAAVHGEPLDPFYYKDPVYRGHG